MPRYKSPAVREADFAQSLREAKEAKVATQRQLTARFGPEGAAAALAALSMTQPLRKPRIKTTYEDLNAVEQLPDY
jgi:hypothetical protein